MAYTDSRGFTDSQDNQKSFNEKYVDNDQVRTWQRSRPR